jgi:hypothetical protein
MIGSESVRLTLTVLFAVLGAWYLASAAAAARGTEKGQRGQALGSALHVLASAAIISMFWSWGAGVPVIAQVTVFTAAAGWFAGQAIFGPAGDAGDHAGGCYGNWYHAGMMAVMGWMAVAMDLMSTPLAGNSMSGMAMPGGAMPGMAMDGPASAGASGAVGGVMPLGWAGTVGQVLAAMLFAAAAWQAIAALRPLAAPERGRSPDGRWPGIAGTSLRDGAGALMAAGMAVALLEMA